MSCEYCIGFTALLGRPYEGDHYTHATSIQALQASADAGCQLCALIIQQLDDKCELGSILEESRKGYPTVIQLVGQTPEGLLNYQKDPYWNNLTGLDVNCGEDGRNDDWSCSLRLYAHEGRSFLVSSLRREMSSGIIVSLLLFSTMPSFFHAFFLISRNLDLGAIFWPLLTTS